MGLNARLAIFRIVKFVVIKLCVKIVNIIMYYRQISLSVWLVGRLVLCVIHHQIVHSAI